MEGLTVHSTHIHTRGFFINKYLYITSKNTFLILMHWIWAC